MPDLSFMPAENTLARRVLDVVGWISLLVTLALCAPGVVATANAEAAVPETAGPGCSAAEASSEATIVNLHQMMERLRLDAARNADPSDEVVVLNNRGFSYPVVPVEEPPAPQR